MSIPTANSLNVVQTTPSIVSVNSAIPLDTVANSNGTAISFTPPTTVLLEGGRTCWQSMKYKLSFNQEVIWQVSLCILIIIQSLDLVLLWDILQDSLLYQHAIFTTPSGITSTLTINVGPYSNTLNTLGLTLAVVALT